MMSPSQTNEPIIGIDLGTTNSLVAYCDAQGPRILTDEAQEPLLPSVIRLDQATGQPQAIGRSARDHAVEYPQHTIFSVKRLMGRGVKDVEDERAYLPYAIVAGDHDTARVQVGDHVISPQQLSAMILRELKQRAQKALGRAVRKAVVTVPAYFDDAQRQATRDAGRLAGLEVVRIVNEPTAASLAYNIGLKDEPADANATHTVAVFDLGGGTFDISILRLQKTGHGMVDQVIATAGDTHLGGDDVDRMIVELIQKEIRDQFGQTITFPPATRQAFRRFAEATKHRLSTEDHATIEVELGEGRVYQRTLTRLELETMLQPWLDRIWHCCRRALQQAKDAAKQIERVVMVGGSTRIPAVQAGIEKHFGVQPYTALNPDEVVAMGAAVQAAILAGVQRDMLLLDVIPLSLGIETMGGAVAKLITANTTIPARAVEMFTTHVDGQTNVKIHVLQGERELVRDCRSLGQFDLRGIPAMPAGLPKIEVTFLVDANGILNVEAVEKRSEKRASIQVIPNHGLSRDEIERIERESVIHASEDMTAHRLIDLRNQARLDMRAIEKQLAKVGDALPAEQRTDIEKKIARVRELTAQPNANPDDLHEALQSMDHASVPLAELAISQTLREEQA